MNKFHNIGFRVIFSLAVLLVTLVAALSIVYAIYAQEKELKKEVHAARNIILMAESVR